MRNKHFLLLLLIPIALIVMCILSSCGSTEPCHGNKMMLRTTAGFTRFNK